MEKARVRNFPLALELMRATEAGEVVTVLIPAPAFAAVPAKAETSVLPPTVQVDDPLEPSSERTPAPTFAVKEVGVFGEASTAVPPLVVV